MLVLTKVDLDSVLAHYDDVAIQVKEVAERMYPTPSKAKWTFFQKVSQSVIKKSRTGKESVFTISYLGCKKLTWRYIIIFFCFCIGLQLTINKVIIFSTVLTVIITLVIITFLLSFLLSFCLNYSSVVQINAPRVTLSVLRLRDADEVWSFGSHSFRKGNRSIAPWLYKNVLIGKEKSVCCMH